MEDEIELLGKLLVYKKNYSPQFVDEIIKKHSLEGLRIFAHLSDQRLDSFDFLKEYTFLTHLSIASLDDHDWDFLKELTNLKYLNINTWGDKKIDVSNLSNLEYLSIIWRKNFTGLENCLNLKTLNFYQYKETNLLKIPALPQIISIIFSTSSLKNLDGIERFSNLKELAIYNCRSLTSIAGFQGFENLEKIIFDMCSKVYDFDSLYDLPQLKTLRLDDCKTIKSIQFLNNLPMLETFRMGGNTIVEDGDLRPAQRIKNIFYKKHKHYKEG